LTWSGYLALANLDFENQLSGRNRPLPSGLLERWRYILRLLPGMAEAECLPTEAGRPGQAMGPPKWGAQDWQAKSLVVWGVTPGTARLAEALGLASSFPTPEVVKQINDKVFSHQLECQLGIALPGSRLVSAFEPLRQAVSDCPHDWVLKHPFGFSGRERMLGKRAQISDSAAGWARRKLSQGWTLLFEPWVEERRDASYHFDILPEGKVKFVGFCRMLTDAGGVYRGTRVDPSEEPDPDTLQCLSQVAAELADRDYWGPVGIDSLTGILGTEACCRPLVELNARYSFGRLALALKDWLPAGSCFTWHHPQMSQGPLPPLPRLKEFGPGLYALPEAADPNALSGTHLEVT